MALSYMLEFMDTWRKSPDLSLISGNKQDTFFIGSLFSSIADIESRDQVSKDGNLSIGLMGANGVGKTVWSDGFISLANKHPNGSLILERSKRNLVGTSPIVQQLLHTFKYGLVAHYDAATSNLVNDVSENTQSNYALGFYYKPEERKKLDFQPVIRIIEHPDEDATTSKFDMLIVFNKESRKSLGSSSEPRSIKLDIYVTDQILESSILAQINCSYEKNLNVQKPFFET